MHLLKRFGVEGSEGSSPKKTDFPSAFMLVFMVTKNASWVLGLGLRVSVRF